MVHSTTVDYIIIGGGSAGCVLANRLSADPGCKVLLVEAGGPDKNILFRIPAGFAKMTKGIGSWGWSTVPQKHMKDRVFWYTQAKVIGGGSSINAQIYTRGHSYDFDHWAQMGCKGWSYADVLPYFRKSEDNDTYDNETHGKSGPMGVSQPSAPLPIARAFIKAAEQLGMRHNPDLAAADSAGFGFYQLTQKNARRSSTSQAFLKPAMARSNLTVKLHTMTTRLVLEGKRVVGVALSEQVGSETVYTAGREVILSSGSIGSPKLLQLSGIGPRHELNKVGIDTLHHLPGVGTNLHDHIDLCVIAECTGDHTYDKYGKPFWAALAGLQYFLTRKGPAASSLFDSGGFWSVDPNSETPDTQFHLGMGSGIEAGIAKLKNAGVTLNAALMRPRSRGSVRLKDANPASHPLIDPNYFADPYDREMSIKGLRLAREILSQTALKDFVQAERVPGPACQTDDQMFDYACKFAKTDHHPAGSCAMGLHDMSVVDFDLRVHGLKGLRVVDASIMPQLVSSNTNATTIMIAEKAADLILSA
jgi:choline dehydrogenase-like flavoprotein